MKKSNITEKEREFLSVNFEHIRKAFGTKTGACTYDQFDRGTEVSLIPMDARFLAPSVRTLKKIKEKGQNISRATASKVLDVYNALFMPPTDLESFLSRDVFSEYRPVKAECRSNTNIYVGRYDCFYFSDNYPDEIHRGILQVYPKDGRYLCYLIMGLVPEKSFSDISHEVFDKTGIDISNAAAVRDAFGRYRANLEKHDDPERNRDIHNISLSFGELQVLDNSILMETRNANNPNHMTVLTVGNEHMNTNDDKEIFSGGMGIYISPATSNLCTRVCKILILRESPVSGQIWNDIIENSLDSFWFQNLKLEANEYNRVEIMDQDINRRIQGKIRELYRRRPSACR